jgi:hypothetical protein
VKCEIKSQLVDIDEASHKEFTKQPPAGKILGADEQGRPTWVDTLAPTFTDLAAQARRYRDAFLTATDQMTLIDYSISDVPLSAEQRAELLAVRQAYKSWTNEPGWPLVELPELPVWLLIEAVNRGYRVPEWPIH